MTAPSPAASTAVRPVDTDDVVQFSDRFSAFVVDFLILAALQLLATFVLSRLLQAAGLRSVGPCTEDQLATCEGPSTVAWIIVALAFVAATVAYHAIFEGRFGATPGKRMAGLTVINADGSPGPIGMARGTVRSLVRQLFWWALLIVFATSGGAGNATLLTAWFLGGMAIGLISWVSAATSATGWSLHDSVAASRVTAKRIDQTNTMMGSKALLVVDEPQAGEHLADDQARVEEEE